MKKVILFISIITSIFVLNNKVYAYKSYKIGDVVTYNDIDFYVIKDSSVDEETVVLLKTEPLNYNEIQKYSATTDSKISEENGYGNMQYHSESANYDTSYVKTTVDAWGADSFNLEYIKELRLITLDELVNNLNYELSGASSNKTGYLTELVPSWVYNSNYGYWTMTKYVDSDTTVWIVTKSGILFFNVGGVREPYETVRPVVELYKCAIDDSCNNNDNEIDNKSEDNKETEKSDINTNKNESKTKVNVPNTIKSVSGLVILIGMVLVCLGLNMLIIIKNKDRKKD